MANLSHDEKTIAEITPLMAGAAAECSGFRRQIQEHESVPHATAAKVSPAR